MRREDLTDLHVFLAVAEERSFTRAAARLGLTQSTLSHAMRGFEDRLGVRLLTRTTRSVAPTEAGERLLRAARPGLDAIDAELAALTELRDRPAGTVRITTSTHAHQTILWPVLARLLPDHPDIQVEAIIENGFVDIVAGRYDAGLRLGEQVERDMIAVRVGPDLRWIVVGAPGYLAGRPAPGTPQDLTAHRCVGYRQSTSGALYAWEFAKDGRALNVRVEGPLVVNDVGPALEAALAGLGLAYVPEDIATAPLRDGRLTEVLADWCPPAPGYHLYYPSRRQMTPAFALLIRALRHG
ncbi:LysR family transcriptional regulator [Rubellimicrobium aerolatum]|uniref:LysR family transcriptional regulator n=1 Tax=Rubellimicrobium aerolatum TaxID=490979 RepID=A0ABW0SF18_9RHOB|nr:LysR family transcriptional regulator [Rubellimicrobium aerolatum]MBP1807060.1 DNA-binding transcriptional LysR family regulator [Rubellimicrobium aerolatum]